MLYQPGDVVLGKYRVERFIGKGASAEVYLATHLELKAPRALKILSRDLPGVGTTAFGDYSQRFQLEAQLGARINHPSVIQVHDFHQDAETLVLVMEYAAGGSLADRIAKARETGQPVPVDEAVRLAEDTAQGLAALHALDCVHRDLKPSNILLDGKGRAKVADLGLAQIPGGPSRGSVASLPLAHPGTPAYMSPEQRVTDDHLMPASDAYSLGCVLFELLTGRLYRNMKPGTRASSLRSDVPQWLDDLVARMGETDSENRPWDGAEVVDLFAEEPQRQAGAQASAEEEQRKVAAREVVEKEARRRQEAAEQQVHADRERARQESARLERERAAAQEAVKEQRLQATARAAAEKDRRLRPMPRRRHQAGVLALAPGVTLELVRIPRGWFLMGSTGSGGPAWGDEAPQRTVTLDDYFIGKYEVTVEEWGAFAKATGYKTTAEKEGSAWVFTGSEWSRVFGADWQNPRGPGADVGQLAGHPVTQVSWDDAVAFTNWASQATDRVVRLPTEAEWEKAARGVDGRVYPWGNEAPDVTRHNFNKNIGTTQVGKYSPRGDSPYGLADMSGNVWEWTSSLYKAYPYRADDGREDAASREPRVLRGGPLKSNASGVHCARRYFDYPYIRLDVRGGFRVVASPILS
jgi:formylglycine-generating enzyme required for sulfatase activity